MLNLTSSQMVCASMGLRARHRALLRLARFSKCDIRFFFHQLQLWYQGGLPLDETVRYCLSFFLFLFSFFSITRGPLLAPHVFFLSHIFSILFCF